MQAEIVSVGTELLLGNIVDTNAALIAQELARYGVNVFHESTVGDNLERGAATIRLALSRSDAVIITGGIGPTPDDATRAAIARALGVELERRPELIEQIKERYARRDRVPTEAALKQADIPAGGEAIPNPCGSAPGVLAAIDGKVVYAMPGVPSEMREMLYQQVLPDLRERFGLAAGLFCRVLRTRGIGESDIATQLHEMLTKNANPTVATYVKTGEVEVRITAHAANGDAAEAMIAPLEAEVRSRIGEFVFGIDDEGVQVQLGRALGELGRTITVAESCTGGGIGDAITAIPGSSAWFRGGVIAYHNAIKTDLLGVTETTLREFGAVSAVCADQMARGVAARCDSDYGLATTGIAGPDGGTEKKPVGLVYIAVYDRAADVVEVSEKRFSGDRAAIKERTVLEALAAACQQIAGSMR